MNNNTQSQTLSRRTALLGALTISLIPFQLATAQDYKFNAEHKRVADDTVLHLYTMRERRVWTAPEDRTRCERGIQHLKEFSAGLHDGKFDKAKLDQGIDDVEKLLETAKIPPHDHDVLAGDVAALHRLRESH